MELIIVAICGVLIVVCLVAIVFLIAWEIDARKRHKEYLKKIDSIEKRHYVFHIRSGLYESNICFCKATHSHSIGEEIE